jgi:mRNA interferase MazF
VPASRGGVCAFPTDETDAPLIRLLIEPNVHNGLRVASRLMVDKDHDGAQTQARETCRTTRRPGVRLNQAILVFLGLTVSPRAKPTA